MSVTKAQERARTRLRETQAAVEEAERMVEFARKVRTRAVRHAAAVKLSQAQIGGELGISAQAVAKVLR